jgi:hypothetical protein
MSDKSAALPEGLVQVLVTPVEGIGLTGMLAERLHAQGIYHVVDFAVLTYNKFMRINGMTNEAKFRLFNQTFFRHGVKLGMKETDPDVIEARQHISKLPAHLRAP